MIEKERDMKVILISAKARAGKDTVGEFIKEILVEKGKRVLVVHYADFLKHFCSAYLGWNGQKDDVGRTMLQYWGTEIVRKNNENSWVDMMIDLIKGIHTEFDYIIIPDTRFPNEIRRMQENFNVVTLRVERPDSFDNGLTPEQKMHPSETSLDDAVFDFHMMNSTTLEDLKLRTEAIARLIE